MTKLRNVFLLCCCIAGSAAAAAERAKEIEWPDLLPPEQKVLEDDLITLQQQLWALPEAERELWYDVAYERSVRDGIEDGTLKEADMTAEDHAILKSAPAAKTPDAVEYWNKVDAARAKLQKMDTGVASELSGERVRIAGYALPLEFKGSEITEFLLVPYVGACIHAPAPPANQIVLVKPTSPFTSDGLFAPVWVEGVLDIESGSHDLSLVDGTAPVETGYAVNAGEVKPYRR